MSKTILFFGTDEFSAGALRSLIAADYTIAAVITKPDSKSGRGQQLTAPLVKRIAEEHSIAVWQPTKLIEVTDDIKKLSQTAGEVIGVLSSYGRIIPQSIIDLFPLGIINIHPSLLPLYRGPSPIESAIFNGDRQTGVSIMRLSAEMDAGPVFAQQPYLLDGSETQPQLYEILADLGARMLIETLPEIIDGRLLAEAQSGDATYSHLLSKSDSLINPEVMTAVEVERKVRAHLDFPKSKLTLMGQLVIVTKAHVSIEQLLDTDVACRDGQFLTIDEVIAPSGKRMSGQAYRNGYAAA